MGLPMLRKHFTAKDVKVPEKKILKDMKPSDMAWALRPITVSGVPRLWPIHHLATCHVSRRTWGLWSQAQISGSGGPALSP